MALISPHFSDLSSFRRILDTKVATVAPLSGRELCPSFRSIAVATIALSNGSKRRNAHLPPLTFDERMSSSK
jgi:hypothetical protein